MCLVTSEAGCGAGRYAPSPTGQLHVGNLRTAVLAWILAKKSGRRFVLRVEDLDRARVVDSKKQLDDLAQLGITWEEPVIYQHSRLSEYEKVIDFLQKRGLVYECYCSRKDILMAASAPHGAPGSYPGTCRNISETQRVAAREKLRQVPGKIPALRLRSQVSEFTVDDIFFGKYTGTVDDFVLRRSDGVFAYNLAVVVDDHFQGVDQVCRGDDLLSSAPRQAYLASILGYSVPTYAHVPLVTNLAGARIAKRDGAVSLEKIRAVNKTFDSTAVLLWIAQSIGVEKEIILSENSLAFANLQIQTALRAKVEKAAEHASLQGQTLRSDKKTVSTTNDKANTASQSALCGRETRVRNHNNRSESTSKSELEAKTMAKNQALLLEIAKNFCVENLPRDPLAFIPPE